MSFFGQRGMSTTSIEENDADDEDDEELEDDKIFSSDCHDHAKEEV
jgi:hypothetical protein